MAKTQRKQKIETEDSKQNDTQQSDRRMARISIQLMIDITKIYISLDNELHSLRYRDIEYDSSSPLPTLLQQHTIYKVQLSRHQNLNKGITNLNCNNNTL